MSRPSVTKRGGYQGSFDPGEPTRLMQPQTVSVGHSRSVYERATGEDTIIQLRVRRANLPAMERGLHFGHARITFIPRGDGTHDMMVEGCGPPPEIAEPVEAIGHPPHARSPGRDSSA